jgi:hypothetical protein
LRRSRFSKLFDELDLQPTVFYCCEKEFFENRAVAFERRTRPNHSIDRERIVYLQAKIQTKDADVPELMAEHVALKNVWETLTGVRVPHHDGHRLVHGYVDHYNNVRLNGDTGYITPNGMLAGQPPALTARPQSLRFQRFYRIDSGGARGRQEACKGRGQNQDERHDGETKRI